MSKLNILFQFEDVNEQLHSKYASNYRCPNVHSYYELFKKFYTPINLHLNNDFTKYEHLFFEACQKYTYAFMFCTLYATQRNNRILSFDSEDFSKQPWYFSSENRIRLKMSALYPYIFPPKPFISINRTVVHTTDTSDKNSVSTTNSCKNNTLADCNPIEPNDNCIQISSSYRRAARLYYDKLYNVSYTLQLYIGYCPYTTFIPEPSTENHETSSESFKKHMEEIQQIPSLGMLTTIHPLILKVLYEHVPLKFFNQYFITRNNMMHNNENFTPTRIRHFYQKYYQTLTEATAYKYSPSESQILFDYFVSEWLLNGTFMFHCLDIFTAHNTVNIQKEVPNIATTLFHSLNQIDNFFLRRVLVDFFIDSYYTPYSFNKESHDAGKNCPHEWVYTITAKIIPALEKSTKELLFKFCCATINKSPVYKEIQNICSFFNMPIVTDAPKHRTQTAKNLILDFVSDYYWAFFSFDNGKLQLPHFVSDTEIDE